MFNLLISYEQDSWDSSPYELPRDRAVVEYTDDEISARYKKFDEKAIEELKSFPTLFVTENETVESRIGYITGIRLRRDTVVIHFEFDPELPSLRKGAIEDLRVEIDLGSWELSRTHWAIKNEPIFEILVRKGYITKEQRSASLARKARNESTGQIEETQTDTTQVFIVHGHDDLAMLEMSRFISDLGFKPIILQHEASSGRTIIEKIEDYTNVGFGIVLYTPCDIGYEVGSLERQHRSRQNVVFEHGYLIGKLGRQKVIPVFKDQIEKPSDIEGLVYITMDKEGNWEKGLKKEIRDLGHRV